MRKCGMGAVLFIVPLFSAAFLGTNTKASANSAPPYWEGTDCAGAILAGDECPIEVKHEKLTLSVPSFASQGGYGSVTAEYEFYNPTEGDISATLVFPMGTKPDYAGDEFPNQNYYSITADGDPVEYTLRYTRNLCWDGGGNSFDIDDGIQKLYAETDELYRDDLPVYVHTVEARAPFAPETSGGDWVNLGIEFEGSVKDTRVFGAESCNFFTYNGKGQIVKGYLNEEGLTSLFTFYAVGKDVTVGKMKIYRYRGNTKTVDEGAHITERPVQTTTFQELADELCKKCGGEEFREDWKDGFISLLEENRIKGTCMCPLDKFALSKSSFLCWYEYSLTVPAKGTVTNTVTAPLYPDVDRTGKQQLYRYVYLLSPASKWANFGGIDIRIETPYYLSDGSFEFEKTENGYVFSRDRLPMGELSFVLTEEERQVAAPHVDPAPSGSLILAIILVCVAAAVTVTVVTIVAVRASKRKKRRREEERKQLMGRAEEGTIDLPEPPHDKNEPKQ